MENKEAILKAYQSVLKATKGMSELEEYDYLHKKFEKAWNVDIEFNSKEHHFFQAITKRLSEVTYIIKAT